MICVFLQLAADLLRFLRPHIAGEVGVDELTAASKPEDVDQLSDVHSCKRIRCDAVAYVSRCLPCTLAL